MPLFTARTPDDITVALLCDRCDTSVTGGRDTAQSVIRDWEDDGWYVDAFGTCVRCPACR